jgi:mannosyl-oligosaccharide alpha-1,2-mannosidase
VKPLEVVAAAAEGPPKVAKRAGIPMPELDRKTEDDASEFGSKLPDSLKEKIGLNQPEAEKTDADKPEAENGGPGKTDFDKAGPVPAESDNKPAAVQDATENAAEPKPATVDSFDTMKNPEQVTAPDGTPLERPMTHEEYVKSRIERERLPPGYTDIINRNYILR